MFNDVKGILNDKCCEIFVYDITAMTMSLVSQSLILTLLTFHSVPL